MYKFGKSKFLILIPAYNELENLKKFIKKINRLVPLCVLDDYSNDYTEEWLLKNNIHFIKNKKNFGYEKNLINGIKKFRKKYDYLITFDGDGQHKISDLKKIINIKMNYDIIVCNRKNKNRFLEVVISIFSNFFFGLRDPLSGFKVYKTIILKQKNFKEIKNYFLVDFLLTFVKSDLKIINIEISTKKRFGSSRVGNSISITFKELKILLKLISKKISLK